MKEPASEWYFEKNRIKSASRKGTIRTWLYSTGVPPANLPVLFGISSLLVELSGSKQSRTSSGSAPSLCIARGKKGVGSSILVAGVGGDGNNQGKMDENISSYEEGARFNNSSFWTTVQGVFFSQRLRILFFVTALCTFQTEGKSCCYPLSRYSSESLGAKKLGTIVPMKLCTSVAKLGEGRIVISFPQLKSPRRL